MMMIAQTYRLVKVASEFKITLAKTAFAATIAGSRSLFTLNCPAASQPLVLFTSALNFFKFFILKGL